MNKSKIQNAKIKMTDKNEKSLNFDL